MLGLGLAAGLLALSTPPVAAASINVNSDCSLAEAIHAANSNTAVGLCPAGSGADEIRLQTNVALTAVDNFETGANGLPVIDSTITILGFGRKVERVAGSPDFRIFHVADTGSLTLRRVKVEGGRLSGGTADAYGAGILSYGNLELIGSVVRDCTVISTGIGGGGGISTAGDASLHLRDSLIETNLVLASNQASGGGISHGPGPVTIYDSTVQNNEAFGGSSASGGGLAASASALAIISGSTFSDNDATATLAFGGAVSGGSALEVENSTFSGNTASIVGGGIIADNGTIRHVTFYDNSALDGSSVFGLGSGDEELEISGSIFVGASVEHCDGAVVLGAANVADDATCAPGVLVSADPLVQTTLQDWGGPTLIHPLATGSDALAHAGNCGLGVDQRSAGRIPPCDSGAFESIGCNLLELAYIDVFGPGVIPYQTCDTAVIGPEVDVIGVTAHLWVTAGHLIVVKNDFSIVAGADATFRIDPAILP